MLIFVPTSTYNQFQFDSPSLYPTIFVFSVPVLGYVRIIWETYTRLILYLCV